MARPATSCAPETKSRSAAPIAACGSCVPRRAAISTCCGRSSNGTNGNELKRPASAALDERLQPAQRLLPLRGDLVEAVAGRVERLAIELPACLPAEPLQPDDAGIQQHLQVL